MFLLLFMSLAWAEGPVRIGIIDTGIRPDHNLKTCALPMDFTNRGINDADGHGSNVAHLITKDVKNYCLIILKYYHTKLESDSLTNELKALEIAVDSNLHVLNLSVSGESYNQKECNLIKMMLDKGTKVIAAAGNSGSNLSNKKVYPAMCDSRITIVGSRGDNGLISKWSNFGDLPNLIYRNGEHVSAGGFMLSGTSQATAKYTNEVVKSLEKDKAK